MSLYKHGRYWYVSMWRKGKHIQVSTHLADKRRARAVEQALSIAGTAVDGAGKRLNVGPGNDEGKTREIVQGLLKAVFRDDSDRTSLDSIWEEYLDVVKVKGKCLSEHTVKDKKNSIGRFIEWAKGNGVATLDAVTVEVARRYSVGLAGKMSDKRRANIITGIASVWNAILSAHQGITNPWPSVSPTVDTRDTTRVGFTREQESKVLAAAQEVHRQWYVACIIAKNTGLRYGDVCRLTIDNVNFETGILSAVPNKTKHSSGVFVRIPMTEELSATLREWIGENERMTHSDRLLPWLREKNGKGNRRFRVVLDRAGLDPEKFTFHSWRHNLASRLGEAGVPVEVRKRILGHTTDVMAERYNHADLTKEMKSALDAAMRTK